MAQQWFCKIDGDEIGPINSSQLKSLAQSGRLSPQHQIRKADSEKWSPASKVQGLFPPAEAPVATATVPPPRTPPTPPQPQRSLGIGRTAYAEANLTSGEHILYAATIHPLIFLPTVVSLIIFVIGVAFVLGSAIAVGIVLIVFGAYCALRTAISALVALLTTECVLTNRRLIAKKGLLRLDSVELLLSKVEGLQVKQGIFGRMFGYGSIIVSGTGGSATKFPGIAAPLAFRKRVQEEVASLQERNFN